MRKDKPASVKTRVLLVEDNPGDADLVRIALADKAPDEFSMTHVSDLAAAVEHLSRTDVDLVLLDLGLPDAEGLQGVERVKKLRPETPLVVLTGLADKATGLAAIERGAQTYVVKGWENADELVLRMRAAIGSRRVLGELAAVSDRLKSAEARLKKIGPDTRTKKE